MNFDGLIKIGRRGCVLRATLWGKVPSVKSENGPAECRLFATKTEPDEVNA
jgi:hypothetical protein